MSLQKKKTLRMQRRAHRVRKRFLLADMRVSVFRSNHHIYAQVIDDIARKTVASASSLTLKNTSGSKAEVARAVGRELANSAKAAGVTKAVFDRGSFLYHGRVKELAEGLREGGLLL